MGRLVDQTQFRHQNGLSRFGMSESDTFDNNMQSPPITNNTQTQGFHNFMDPRMSGYDPRSRPNFDPSSMMPGMEAYSAANSNYSAKMRMNDMAAMFGNPAALAAYQRQRMSMFGQGRDTDFMSPTNPFSGFNPQQAAQIMQEQQRNAFQRQVHEQLATQHMPGSRNSDMSRQEMIRQELSRQELSRQEISRQEITRQEISRQDMNRQYSSPGGSSTGNGQVPGSPFSHSSQDGFPGGFSPQSRSGVAPPVSSDLFTEMPSSSPVVGDHRTSVSSANNQSSMLNESPVSNKYPNTPSGSSTPMNPFDQGNDAQRNAAMLAAAAVRAAAAASTRGARGGFPIPSPGGGNAYPFGLRGYQPPGGYQMQSPYPSQGMHSPEYGGVMSPARESAHNSLSQSPLSQGKGSSRNDNPPPYSPMSHMNEINLSGSSASMKGSLPNLSNILKQVPTSSKSEENVTLGESSSPSPFEVMSGGARPSTPVATSMHDDSSQEKGFDINHFNSDDTSSALSETNNVDTNESSNKLPATPTPVSTSSPAPSPFQDDIEIDNFSPSWPQSPLSPSAQKLLKSQASPKQYDQLSKVYDLIEDDEKRNFFDRYLAFMSVNGTPVTKLPIIGKQSLDLYTLFRAVCERGGIQEVMEKRCFLEVLTCLNLPPVNTVAYSVKEQYMKYLHAYEIKAKDVLLKQWKNNITLNNSIAAVTPKSEEEDVPTIALNDSFHPADIKAQTNQDQATNLFHGNSTEQPVSSWNQSLFPSSSVATTSSMTSSAETSLYNARMSYPNPLPANQGLLAYGQPGMPGYGGQDIPSGYSGYGGYQNHMYTRAPMQNYANSIRPNMANETMPGSWPRAFPPRQGPPELFPEGLQRMPWSQSSQRHVGLSAFSSPSFQSGKKGGMPPISRDSMEQIKYNAQQQLKMQQLQQHQQQIQKQRFSTPEPTKVSKAGPRMALNEVRPMITPAQPMKREFNFPTGSIECTKPTLRKRKKLTSKELGPVEAWRIMMSLKSGLVAECSWAIDTLNILLADNNTITCFHLNQLPGLLDTLMDHYRRSLSDLFNTFTDLEIPLLPEIDKSSDDEEPTPTTVDENLVDLWVGVCKNSKCSYTSNIASNAVLNCSDKSNKKEHLHGGKHYWEKGGGDCTTHVQTSFPTRNIPLKGFPQGVPYVTRVEAEKQRKLEKIRKHKVERTCSSPVEKLPPSDENNITDAPKSPVIEYLPPDSKVEQKIEVKKEPIETKLEETSIEVSTACLGVLDDLLTECNDEMVEEKDPLIEKILADLEFNIPCDRKYLEDSKEFIEYLNRRLLKENRGNVISEQCVVKQSTPFVNISESKKCLIHRCVALSNVFRSLSFIQGNDSELANHIGLMLLSSFILLHKHEHAVTDHSQFKLGLDERTVLNNAISDSEPDWWWDSIHAIRENTLVMLSNIGGHLDLSLLSQQMYEPLVNGLLHWLVCRSSESLDPMSTAPGSHALSAKKLAMETLAKMTINSANIELVVCSQSKSRLEEINEVLLKQISKKHPIPSREFAIILLDNLAHNEQFNKVLARRKSAVRSLVKFVYEAEKSTSNYLSSGGRIQPGINAEDICGTSISLLRRSVNILLSIVKLPCNRPALAPYTDDLLALSTLQMIDTSVLALLAQVLFELHDT